MICSLIVLFTPRIVLEQEIDSRGSSGLLGKGWADILPSCTLSKHMKINHLDEKNRLYFIEDCRLLLKLVQIKRGKNMIMNRNHKNHYGNDEGCVCVWQREINDPPYTDLIPLEFWGVTDILFLFLFFFKLFLCFTLFIILDLEDITGVANTRQGSTWSREGRGSWEFGD